jgi:hypothetical protein
MPPVVKPAKGQNRCGKARMLAINAFDGAITLLRLAAPALDH